METPESMKAELSAWNNGAGIDLKSWVGCEGSFSLAVGYATVFWPEFVEFEGYILTKGFSETSLREFAAKEGSSRNSVEWVMNHLHIADLHYGRKDISKDKILLLGNVLKEIYQAKLRWQFPDRPCIVEFDIPEDPEDLMGYQISFWQRGDE
jgi:hypothetical protein